MHSPTFISPNQVGSMGREAKSLEHRHATCASVDDDMINLKKVSAPILPHCRFFFKY